MKQALCKPYQVMLAIIFCSGLLFPSILLAQKGEMPIAASFVLTRNIPPQSSDAPKKLTRGQLIAFGAIAGGCAGLVFGEYVLGRKLDVPHGPDMLLGAGIGATVGALIGWVVPLGEPAASNSKRSASVAPLLSPSRKALVITLALN